MTTFNYIELAQRTKSPNFHGSKVTMAILEETLQGCIGWLNVLDKVKKSFFYGKDNFEVHPVEIDCRHANQIGGLTNEQSTDVIHAILGKATEAGELLELLHSCVFERKSFDAVNFKEELGDGMWYDAIGCAAVGTTFEEEQLRNIAKLQDKFAGRFKTGDFNASEAINRDHVAERVVLEMKDGSKVSLPVELKEHHAEGMDDTAEHAVKQKDEGLAL